VLFFAVRRARGDRVQTFATEGDALDWLASVPGDDQAPVLRRVASG
jgi:hypothetical protein